MLRESRKRLLIIPILVFVGLLKLSAQQVALKTNLLYDATTTPNIGVELALGQEVTGQLFYGLNPWTFSDREKMKHWLLMPEVRYWLCERFNGHFFGIHGMGGQFNTENIDLPIEILPDMEKYHYEGWYAGGGLTYGYQWVLAKHWNVEASAGFGYDYIKYKKYDSGECGILRKDAHKHYVGLTKAVVSLIYIF